jgi:hypothetical protein
VCANYGGKKVSLAGLGKRLRREAVASPKKAVFLGVAALVALYFWMPLFKGWFVKSDQVAAMPASATAESLATPAAIASIAKSQTGALQPSWLQINEWMHSDPRTMAAPPLKMTRNPFESPAVETARHEAIEQPKPKPPAVTPTAAGLTLTGTIIGPHRSVAQINGRAYAVGQNIAPAKAAGSPDVVFRLIDVQTRRAVLESQGEKFELTIPEPGKSPKIDLIGALGRK